jgi:hypothetical protein
MAHFAQLNDANQVVQVIVVNNNEIENLPFPESEPLGIAFCQSLLGENTQWAQTSYSASFRYNYAGIGYFFDASVVPNGAFIPPQPFASWVLDKTTYQWAPPMPYPSDGGEYVWNEEAQNWVKF